jgi:hypothetical protein
MQNPKGAGVTPGAFCLPGRTCAFPDERSRCARAVRRERPRWHLALKHGADFVRIGFIAVALALILKTGRDAFVR